MGLRAVCCVFLVWAALAASAFAQPYRTDHVEIELHAARERAAPGETVTMVLRQKMNPGWHVYWLNPGDSGYPTSLDWTLPEGVTVTPLRHPAPEIYRLGPIVNYIHQGETLYPFTVQIPPGQAARGALTLTARARWLVCEEECIPEEGDVSLRLPLAREGRDDRKWAKLANEAIAALPQDLTAGGFDAKTVTNTFEFSAPVGEGSPLGQALAGKTRNAHFYPFSQSLIDHAAPQRVKQSNARFTVEAPLSVSFDKARFAPAGVLTLEVEAGGAWVKRAFQFGATPGASEEIAAVDPPGDPAPSAPAAPNSGLTLWSALAFGLLGGLILNVMPCVFPVLSLKALSFASASPAKARREGVLFFAGVMVTFLTLAAALIALQSAGAQIGWGFQLQSPWVTSALALLFFALGLNLAGMFEFGGLQNVGSGLAEKPGGSGAFFTGALAVLAASPCTAPFMGGALGWAATQPPAASLAVFAALGAGFAAPFTALAFAPGLRKILPKPGAWMERFKQFLAFPMFATAIWLAWVLTMQVGPGGVLAVLALALALAFGVWAWRGGILSRGLAALVLVGAAVLAFEPLSGGARAQAQVQTNTAQGAWTAERVAELRAAGKPVFVNFTAAWCVSCQANEAVALSRPRVLAAFEQAGITYLKGDWTSRDENIARELAAYGRAGVPLYLYFAPGAESAKVLPQLLTEQIVLDAIDAGS
jgi:thiol:disulfide interchange protein DsbD